MLIAEKGNGDEYGIATSREVFHRKYCSINFRDYEYIEGNMANRMDSTILIEKIIALGWKAENNLPDYIKSKL